MIIRRLQLHPYAGAADREFAFEPGLNVLLGPNEAGKSTVAKAIRQALLVPVSLHKRDRDVEVAPRLPLAGGDTIRVSLDLESGGRSWKLRKSWGGRVEAELILPDGGLLTDSEQVEDALSKLLVLNRGTWENVLFAHQGEIGHALERIEERADLDHLAEVLRRAVFQTDGVSIEALGEAIESRWEGAFSRWDRERGRPEGNRGLDHPWQRGAGRVVNAWYDRERARIALEAAESYYRALDDLTARLAAAAAENQELRDWVETRAAIAADTETRLTLEGKLTGFAAEEAELKKISTQWPVAEAKVAELAERATALARQAESLTAALDAAKAWEAAGQKRRTLEQAEKLAARIDEARQVLADGMAVEPGQVRELEKLDADLLGIRARLEAARLSVRFRARRAMPIETEAGTEPPETRSLEAGETLAFEAGARAAIRHADWELEVRSGEIDVEAETTRKRELEEKKTALLGQLGAVDLPDARKRAGEHRERQAALQGLQDQLAELLGDGPDLATLRTEVARAAGGPGDGNGPGDASRRPAADLAEERGRTHAELQAVQAQAAEQRTRLEAWVRAYQSPEALLDLLVAKRADRQGVETRLGKLQPLPEGFDDPAAFLDQFRRRRADLESRTAACQTLQIEKAALQARAPELEPDEARQELERAEAAFDRAGREGAAIERIRAEFEALRDEMDRGTLDPWLAHLSEIVAPLTDDRYQEIELAGPRPGFVRADGVSVPFDALSMGTRAGFGLAVRLSMARYFLGESDGFLVLDDPLVDLDPDRQAAAAAILQAFSAGRQVIVPTCHPSHAELLGGNRVVV